MSLLSAYFGGNRSLAGTDERVAYASSLAQYIGGVFERTL